MKKYHSVVLFCMVLSLDTTWGSSNHHENRSREEQDREGRTIEVSSSSNGSSSEDSSPRIVTRKATKKTTATPTSAPTPSMQMFREKYPEVQGRSLEEQKHLYKVYKLYLKGATPEELAKYAPVALNLWSCCLDWDGLPPHPYRLASEGCYWSFPPGSNNPQQSHDFCYAKNTTTDCYEKGWNFGIMCCRSWPLPDRIGARAWPWTACVPNDPFQGQCAGNYGSTVPCCGEEGTGTVGPKNQCPQSKPYCVNYVYDEQWGTCVAAPPCVNCFNSEPCCRDQGDGNGGPFDFSCPGCANGRI